MRLIKPAELSRICGISKAAVSKAIKAERLVLTEKKIDLDNRINREFLTEKEIDPDKIKIPEKPKKEKLKPKPKKKDTPKKQPAKKKSKDKQEEKPDPVKPPGSDIPQVKSLDDINETNLFLMPKTDIEKFKTYQQAKKAKMDVELARGLLIERRTVKVVFSKLYTVDNNELKAMEERLTPAICGVFGKTDDSEEGVKVKKMINDEVTKSLRHIKRVMNDFLKRQGAKELKEEI